MSSFEKRIRQKKNSFSSKDFTTIKGNCFYKGHLLPRFEIRIFLKRPPLPPPQKRTNSGPHVLSVSCTNLKALPLINRQVVLHLTSPKTSVTPTKAVSCVGILTRAQGRGGSISLFLRKIVFRFQERKTKMSRKVNVKHSLQ